MTDEEAFSVQAYGGLLEFVMATYEGLMDRRCSSQAEMRRHKAMIQTSFIEMGPTLLKACEHMGLERNHLKKHPRWDMNLRLKILLKDLLISGLSAEAVVNIYLKEAEEHRARHV